MSNFFSLFENYVQRTGGAHKEEEEKKEQYLQLVTCLHEKKTGVKSDINMS